MPRIRVYTSPVRGHLYPILGPALELAERGHDVRVHTLSAEVERVRSLGMKAEPITKAVEAVEMDDWKADSPRQALMRGLGVCAARAT